MTAPPRGKHRRVLDIDFAPLTARPHPPPPVITEGAGAPRNTPDLGSVMEFARVVLSHALLGETGAGDTTAFVSLCLRVSGGRNEEVNKER